MKPDPTILEEQAKPRPMGADSLVAHQEGAVGSMERRHARHRIVRPEFRECSAPAVVDAIGPAYVVVVTTVATSSTVWIAV